MLNEIQRRSTIPIVIDADIERGLGQRFPSGTDFPPLMAITATGNPNNAYEVGAIVAKESRLFCYYGSYFISIIWISRRSNCHQGREVCS